MARRDAPARRMATRRSPPGYRYLRLLRRFEHAAAWSRAELGPGSRVNIGARGSARRRLIESLLVGLTDGDLRHTVPAIDCSLFFAVVHLLPQRPGIPGTLHVAGALRHVEVSVGELRHAG